MNQKIIILISLIIIIIIIGFSLTQTEITENTTEEQTLGQFQETDKISSMLEKIKDDKMTNEKSDNPYVPKEREWIGSGPFEIDRSEYVLGEKVFINVNDLPKNIKGKMIFSKIINKTHSYEYKKINFDSNYPQKNFYLGLNLNAFRGLCTADMLVGNWEIIFEGTPVQSLKFRVIDKIIPGMEDFYKPVC